MIDGFSVRHPEIWSSWTFFIFTYLLHLILNWCLHGLQRKHFNSSCFFSSSSSQADVERCGREAELCVLCVTSPERAPILSLCAGVALLLPRGTQQLPQIAPTFGFFCLLQRNMVKRNILLFPQVFSCSQNQICNSYFHVFLVSASCFVGSRGFCLWVGKSYRKELL